MSELLDVKSSLGVAGVDPEPWVCSGHRSKLKGTSVSGLAGVCVSPVSVGRPSYVGKDVVVSTMILNISKVQYSWVYPIPWELSFPCDPVIQCSCDP